MNEEQFIGQHAEEQQDTQEESIQEDIQQDGIQDDLPQLTEIEQKAFDQGWRPKEEFQGPEENWKSAKEYVRDGEFLEKIKELNNKIDSKDREFKERLDNANKLNEMRRQAEIEQLKKQQRDAVDMSDIDAYDNAQKQIETLESQQIDVPASQPGKDPAIIAWEAENPWINNPNDEKTAIAQSLFNNYAQNNPSATPQQALAHIDERLSKLYPSNNTNPRRSQPDTNETPRRQSRKANRELTMSDLTPSETAEWNQYGKMMFKTQEAFLKAVKDARTN